jgi:hypothetical protein
MTFDQFVEALAESHAVLKPEIRLSGRYGAIRFWVTGGSDLLSADLGRAASVSVA